MQTESDELFKKAQTRYPDRDPEVDWLFRDLSKLPIVQQRGGMNACVYIPVFDVTLKYLRQQDMDTTLPTILLTAAQRFIEPVLASHLNPNPFHEMQIYPSTLSAMYTTINLVADYLNTHPEFYNGASY